MSLTKIRILDEQTINKIAAGEVIENSSSVIKELVENALDAGASEICVEIKGGGRQLIRISDNGCGMSNDDALLCLERHATSKIRDVNDIQQLMTMGFRGEAIPSIASISKFTLLTCLKIEDKKNNQATMIIIEGGQIMTCVPAVRSPGTTIEVKSLFFNVPVRKKFQKSPNYDTQEVLKVLGLLSLSRPDVKFELIADQKLLLNTASLPPDHSFHEKLGNRVEAILGKEFFSALLPISLHQEGYHLEGFIGLPTFNRHNRTGQYLFINQRTVHSSLVAFAVREGYGTMLASHRYPVFVLHLQLPGSCIDVNVHPQKKEIRLRQEQDIKNKIIQAVQETLQQVSSCPIEEPLHYPFVSDQFTPHSTNFPFFVAESPQNQPWQFDRAPSSTPHFNASLPASYSINAPLPLQNLQPTSSNQLAFSFESKQKSGLRVIAVLAGYILIDPHSIDSQRFSQLGLQPNGGLCIVDQKGAYSRIYYERLLKQQEQKENVAQFIQPILMPLTIEFSKPEALLLKEQLGLLQKMGFGIQEFGETTFLVDAVPSPLKPEEVHTCLITILEDLKELQDGRRLQRDKEKQLAIAACRNSSQTSRLLSLEEAQALIYQLMSCETPLQCPHGKPTLIYLSANTLAQYFDR